MRIIFMGTPDFAVPTLQALVDAGHEVVLVVAQPDRRAGRGKKMRSPPVAVRAKELGLPLAQPRALRKGPWAEKFASRLEGLNADAGVVLAYGRILPQRLLDAPKHGCINVHASLLPRWRGAAPIQAAILAGDETTGVCTQQMEVGLDTGPVYVRNEISIDPRETGGSLHDKLMELSATCAVETLPLLGNTEPVPQTEDGVTWADKISKQDGFVDLTGDAGEHDRRIRAMSPWPGGWTTWGEERLKLKAVKPVDGSGAPRQVLSTDPLVVACGTGALQLDRVQAPGKKAVSGRDFANGARLSEGDTL